MNHDPDSEKPFVTGKNVSRRREWEGVDTHRVRKDVNEDEKGLFCEISLEKVRIGTKFSVDFTVGKDLRVFPEGRKDVGTR